MEGHKQLKELSDRMEALKQSFITQLDDLQKQVNEIVQTAIKQNELQDEGDINFASGLTGYTKGTISQYVYRGEIPYSKHGRKLWFKRSELNEWLNERQYM